MHGWVSMLQNNERNRKPAKVFNRSVVCPCSLDVVHNIVNAAEPGYSAADTGCKILVTGDIYTGSIRCCRAFTNGPEIESAIGAFEEYLNKYCNYDCGVNHKTVIKEHLLQSFGKRQPTENLCAEESAGSFNAYLTDTACKLVEGTSEEICNARAEIESVKPVTFWFVRSVVVRKLKMNPPAAAAAKAHISAIRISMNELGTLPAASQARS